MYELADISSGLTFYPLAVRQAIMAKHIGARQEFLQDVANQFRVHMSEELRRAMRRSDAPPPQELNASTSLPSVLPTTNTSETKSVVYVADGVEEPLCVKRPNSATLQPLPHYAKSLLLQYVPFAVNSFVLAEGAAGSSSSSSSLKTTRAALEALCPVPPDANSTTTHARLLSTETAVEVLVKPVLLDALRVALKTMAADERALFLVDGEYGFASSQKVPKDLLMVVHVHNVSQQVDLTDHFLPAFLQVPTALLTSNGADIAAPSSTPSSPTRANAPPPPPPAPLASSIAVGYHDDERLLRPKNVFVKHVVSGPVAAQPPNNNNTTSTSKSKSQKSATTTTAASSSSEAFQFPLPAPYVDNASPTPRFGASCWCTVIEVHPITATLCRVWPLPNSDANAAYVIGGRLTDLLKEQQDAAQKPPPIPANRVLGHIARPSFFWSLVDQALLTMGPGEFATFTYQPNITSGVGSFSAPNAANATSSQSGGAYGSMFSSASSSAAMDHAVVFKIRLTRFDPTSDDAIAVPRNSSELLAAMNRLKEIGNKLHETKHLRGSEWYEEALRLCRAARGQELSRWCATLQAHATEVLNTQGVTSRAETTSGSSSRTNSHNYMANSEALSTPPMMTPTMEKQTNFLSTPSSLSFASATYLEDAPLIAQLLQTEILLEGNLAMHALIFKEYLRAALHSSNAILLFKLRQWCMTGTCQSSAATTASMNGASRESSSSTMIANAELPPAATSSSSPPTKANTVPQQPPVINVHRFFFRRAKAKRMLKLYASARKDLMEAQDWMGHVALDSPDWTEINRERTELENAAH